MKKIGHVTTLAVLAMLVVSCTSGLEDGSDSAALSTGSMVVPLCRDFSRELRGRGASVWRLLDAKDMLAVQVQQDDGADIFCVDTIEITLDLGLIAIPPIAEGDGGRCPASFGEACDGTPIPADKFNAAARSHAFRDPYFAF